MVTQAMRPMIAHLKEVKLFACFREAELGRLLAVGQGLLYEAHSNIIVEGEQSWGLFVILDGMVGVYKANPLTGESFDVCQMRAGSFFGEMSLIDEKPRSATVRTLTETQVLMITKEAFSKFISSAPDLRMRFYESVIRNLVSRMRELDENYVVSQYQLWKTALNQKKKERGSLR